MRMLQQYVNMVKGPENPEEIIVGNTAFSPLKLALLFQLL